MIINADNLAGLTTGFKANFNQGRDNASPAWPRVASMIPSSSKENVYPFLMKLPRLREWIGERVIQNAEKGGYAIENRDFEMTVEVDRNDIEDDQYGVYAPLMQEMGATAASHPDELVFSLARDGFEQFCYDGVPFFSEEHKIKDESGVEQSWSNMQDGNSDFWMLLDTSGLLKPFVFQKRRDYQFVMKTAADDDDLFWRKAYVYGVDGRCNAGYGFWQLAFGSKAELNAANFQQAWKRMAATPGERGARLSVQPDLLVVGPSNYIQACELLKSERGTGGRTNVLRGMSEILLSHQLS